MFLRFLSITLLCSIPVHGYVEGYDRLYHKDTKVVIDMLHDAHEGQKRLSRRDMTHKSFSYIKKRLYKTEARILDALTLIEQVDPHQVELVWELGKFHSPGDSAFLAHGHTLVKQQFPKLDFIAGDLSRDAFEDILLIKPARRPKDLTYSLDGTSIGTPVPLPNIRIKAIEKNYGTNGCQQFKKYFTTITKRATNYYKKGFLSGKRFKKSDFDRVSPFDALGDAEMLSYILSSEKKHIIVYCGGWHGDNLTEFLVKKMGFKLTHDAFNQGHELKVRDLASLDKDYRGPGTAV